MSESAPMSVSVPVSVSAEMAAIESLEREEEHIAEELAQAFLDQDQDHDQDRAQSSSDADADGEHESVDMDVEQDEQLEHDDYYPAEGADDYSYNYAENDIDVDGDGGMDGAPPDHVAAPVSVAVPDPDPVPMPAPVPDPALMPASNADIVASDEKPSQPAVEPAPAPVPSSTSSVPSIPSKSPPVPVPAPQHPNPPAPAIRLENGTAAPKREPPPHLTAPPPIPSQEVKREPEPSSASRLDQLRARIASDPFDAEAHLALVAAAESAGDVDAIKAAYEGLLKPFAGASTLQISYLTHFLNSAADFKYAEGLFSRFLRTSPSVDLWKFYLTYIRRVNVAEGARETAKKAYEFALGYIGQDKDSGDLWKDYLTFLKEGPTNSTWEEQQKMDNIRRVYQRCVVIPLENVEQLWREFDAFESSLNKVTAKKFLATHSPAYMTARTSLRALRTMLDPLTRTPPPMGLPVRPTWTDADRHAVSGWKTYLKWEEGNPLDIEDPAALAARVQAAYRKALAWMRFFPEIWYMAYHYIMSLNKVDEAAALLKQGMDANPSSFLLHFAYGELEETRKNIPQAHACFESLISTLTSQITALKKSIESEADAAMGPVPSSSEADGNEDLRKQAEEREARGQRVWARRGKELDELRTATGVVWIMLMRFARRAEGLKQARTVFGRARRSEHVVWQVYEASALMEYHCTKSSEVAGKIFELGLKSFNDNIEYVLRYLGFLISINDDGNARALFERVIPTFTPDKARPLWERWARYEYNFGDFAAAQRLEKRIAEAYPNDPPIKRFAQRFQYLSLDTIASRDLGFGIRPPQPAAAPAPAAAAASVPTTTAAAPTPTKRPASPSPPPRREKRREISRERVAPPKRFKPSPPPLPPPRERGRERERDRGWERERDRIGSPRRDSRDTPPRPGEDGPPGAIPPLVSFFMSKLPSAAAFDGPVFRTDDLLQVFRSTSIPSLPPPPPVRARSPPLRAAGRPPPDYGPYRGPNSSGRRW